MDFLYPRIGFDSFPTKAVEMPPTYVLVLALGFASVALCFWVCDSPHQTSLLLLVQI